MYVYVFCIYTQFILLTGLHHVPRAAELAGGYITDPVPAVIKKLANQLFVLKNKQHAVQDC